jgi:hypothetical protein
MTEDEDRLRKLLRAPLPGATRAAGRVSPARFESAHHLGRARGIATISTAVVLVVMIAIAVTAFRVTADRPRLQAGGVSASLSPARTAAVPSIAALIRNIRCSGHRSPAGPAQVRAFVPVAALRCAYSTQGSGVVRDVAAGPLGKLVAGLERADATPSDKPCATYYDAQPALVLVDASGHYLRPRFPRDPCGHLSGTPAYLAYNELTWSPITATEVTLRRHPR